MKPFVVAILGLVFLLVSSAMAESTELLVVGESCTKDSECASSCCHGYSGVCKAHDPANGIYCGKLIGEYCSVTEQCQFINVVYCYKVKIPGDSDMNGNQLCRIRCVFNPQHAQCDQNIGACIPISDQIRYSSTDATDCSDANGIPDILQ